MTNTEFEIDAGPVNDFPINASKIIPYRNFHIAIFHRSEGWFAVKDPCPHAGEPLSKGNVEGCVVTCPGHNWKFRLDTGECTRGDVECSIRTYPIEIKADRVIVKVR